MSINKHKNIIDKEELLFKNEKKELIERIIFLQTKIGELTNPDSKTNDTYHNDDSFEEQTIKDKSFNDFSLMKDSVYDNPQIIEVTYIIYVKMNVQSVNLSQFIIIKINIIKYVNLTKF